MFHDVIHCVNVPSTARHTFSNVGSISGGINFHVAKRAMVPSNGRTLCTGPIQHYALCAKVTVVPSEEKEEDDEIPTPAPEPSIWCANHVSAIDTFLFLATDDKLRGKARRPIKVVYVSRESGGFPNTPQTSPHVVIFFGCVSECGVLFKDYPSSCRFSTLSFFCFFEN
jgi:hypothetical protein